MLHKQRQKVAKTKEKLGANKVKLFRMPEIGCRKLKMDYADVDLQAARTRLNVLEKKQVLIKILVQYSTTLRRISDSDDLTDLTWTIPFPP